MDSLEANRVWSMGVIFIISLFAVSFPAVSKRTTFLSIPKIIFFIGKHFGTGVILCTAFGHLLQDAFEALNDSSVRSNYPGVGERTGLIILASLLSIFFIEYISTAYVDHLHAEPSAPSSPTIPPSDHLPAIIEETPLLGSSIHSQAYSELSDNSTHIHPTHRKHYLSSVVQNNPRFSRSSENFYLINDLKDHVGRGQFHVHNHNSSSQPPSLRRVCVEMCDNTCAHNESSYSEEDEGSPEEPKRIGRKRQVVGILVLQFGIMIHSLVIGMTLSITQGTEFTSLVTAIIFHQLFEGLSVGIRIAALPLSPAPTVRWLEPILTFLFAVTTPLGFGIGMLAFGTDRNEAKMMLIQGLMSAISAGMLIYAATIEMMAGDFVFGSLGGQAHAGGGHSHGGNFLEEEEEEGDTTGAPLPMKVLAAGSLLAGVVGMTLICLVE